MPEDHPDAVARRDGRAASARRARGRYPHDSGSLAITSESF